VAKPLDKAPCRDANCKVSQFAPIGADPETPTYTRESLANLAYLGLQVSATLLRAGQQIDGAANAEPLGLEFI
jgi:hypothetical protein